MKRNKPLKKLVTGGQGEFAKQLVKHNPDCQILTPSKSECDVTSFWYMDRYFYNYQKDYDYVLVNDNVDDCFNKLKKIISKHLQI